MRTLFTLLLASLAGSAMAQQQPTTVISIPNASVPIPGVTNSSPDVIFYKDTTTVVDWDKMKKPFPKADVKPRFNGSLNQYLSTNVHMPKGAKPQGTVNMEFVVDTNGRVGMVTANEKMTGNKKLTPLEKELIRVVKAMPPWIPGMREGKKVPVKYSLPINLN